MSQTRFLCSSLAAMRFAGSMVRQAPPKTLLSTSIGHSSPRRTLRCSPALKATQRDEEESLTEKAKHVYQDAKEKIFDAARHAKESVSGAAEEIKEQAEEFMHQGKQDAAYYQAKAEDRAESVKESAQDAAHRAKESATDAAEDVKERAKEAIQRGKEGTAYYKGKAENRVDSAKRVVEEEGSELSENLSQGVEDAQKKS